MSVEHRLVVYGSLAPGKSNHHMLADYPGTWTTGRVRGDLINAGWGATGGFPGLVPRADGPWIPVRIFESAALAHAWPKLDAFEGDDYQRVSIPVYAPSSEVLLFEADVYAVRPTRK
ncbi:MAG TPA: gamma-glutamylcyclotransferase family protein [Gemmatimonadaceae bacterium]|nr:gamma-glutamylcyclotransferase family protein [Gemmatimonadaceae bacterium]